MHGFMYVCIISISEKCMCQCKNTHSKLYSFLPPSPFLPSERYTRKTVGKAVTSELVLETFSCSELKYTWKDETVQWNTGW